MKELQLTDTQINDMKYFWEDKGDLERWTSFEELRPLIQKEFPEVLNAWYSYKNSITLLDSLFEDIEYKET